MRTTVTNFKRKMQSMNPAEAAEKTKGEKQNGVYLIGIESAYDGYLLLPNDVSADPIHVDLIRINGQYVGTDDRAEMECRDYEVVDDSPDDSPDDFHKWVLQITMAPEDAE